jgi:hypothetical protein
VFWERSFLAQSTFYAFKSSKSQGAKAVVLAQKEPFDLA